MNVGEFAQKINAEVLTGKTGLERQVGGLYACDLLSRVIGHSLKGDAWITVHTNLNIVAVALLAELSCIIIPEGIKVEQATISRALLEGIPVLSSCNGTYKICCTAHAAGIAPVNAS